MLHLHSNIYLAPLASLTLHWCLQTIPSIFTSPVFTWFSSYFSSDSWNAVFLSGTHLHNLLNNQLASTPGKKKNKFHLLSPASPCSCQAAEALCLPEIQFFTKATPENINFGSNIFHFYRFLACGMSSASWKKWFRETVSITHWGYACVVFKGKLVLGEHLFCIFCPGLFMCLSSSFIFSYYPWKLSEIPARKCWCACSGYGEIISHLIILKGGDMTKTLWNVMLQEVLVYGRANCYY